MKRCISALVVLALLSAMLVVPVTGEELGNNPIPADINPSGVSVEIVDVLRMPDTRDIPDPKEEDDRPATNYARINFLRLPPDGTDRWFVNDMRGRLYVVNGPEIMMYLDFHSEFAKLSLGKSFNAGFISFAFHPEFKENGKFYTTHTEKSSNQSPNFEAPDPPIDIKAHGVLTEWTADDSAANTFTGSRRELMRIALYASGHHAFGEIAFNPLAQPGASDYGLLYIAFGDAGLLDPVRRRDQLNRLDSIYGSLLRIDPLGNNSANGQYGIPESNPFANEPASVVGEIFAYGFRNPHRFVWDASDGTLIGIDTGQNHVEEVNLIHEGGNYGWAFREGTFVLGEDPPRPPSGTYNPWDICPLPEPDVAYEYPVAQYDHWRNDGSTREGVAIAGGQLYTGDVLPELKNQFVFGDIKLGRIFHAHINDLKQADDGDPATMATIEELLLTRGGQTVSLREDVINGVIGVGANPKNRADIRFFKDRYGEILITTKMDGYIRRLGPGAVHQTLQAEDATLGGGARVNRNHAGHYGNGYVNLPSAQGFIEWTNVDGGAEGAATLEFRNALGASASRTVQLLVNGAEQALTFESTGDWETWQLTAVPVRLNPGSGNVIRLQTDGEDSANIDELRVLLTGGCAEGAHYVESNGTVVMEGEHFTGADASRDVLPWEPGSFRTGAVGNTYMVTHSTPPVPDATWEMGAELSYAMQFETPGSYHVWLRRYAAGSKKNSVFVGIDGERVNDFDDGTNFDAWVWQKIDDTLDVSTPGLHTLQLRRREAGYRVDRILLTTDGGFTPTGDGPAESERVDACAPDRIILEAEDAFISDGRVESGHPGFSGSGYVNYDNEVDSFVRWTVPALPSQAYALAFRYANGASEDRPMDIDVNGLVVEESLSFLSTGDWANWSVWTTTASLQTGDTVQATAITSDGGPNVDYLELTPVVEAEGSRLVDCTCDIDMQHDGYTGDGYVNFDNDLGSFGTWAVTVSTDGMYVLTFRYANGSSADRRLEIEVNGSIAVAGLSFPSTDAWDHWALRRAEVHLDAGLNTIRATALTPQGGPNLDHAGYSFAD